VRVAGRANRVTINEVSGAIRGLRAVGIRHLVIDMSAALDCDPRLLRVLARAHTQLADDAGALRITGVKLPQFLDALQAATLDEVFVIYDALRRETPPPIPRPPNFREEPGAS
jgi:anti-anti-sigma regulatory factor